ncbi:expressed unknown protein [Seminavis robusta]|uniref:Uncharacterized protein n=1 Tax=Seminavis robusta TaxID=568900 RepID=A0A9N8EGA3_9STRA|nr:expressed unknown protein [Seminavis robusta]|eukprot:Sro901_g218080.1 n/a (693) ;mRNA; f:36102-38180
MADDDFDDGWGEDLDDLIDDEDDVGELNPSADVDQGEGWGDDLDDLEVDQPLAPPPVAAQTEDSGWGDDDDLDLSDTEDPQPLQVQTPAPRQKSNPQVENVYHELVSYVESLMILLPSINAVLQAEYNHPEKAQELLHYYRERPQLREYTIEKELARMDYQVMLLHASGEEPTVVDNKQEIAQLFKLQNELDLLVRCANQSLLADLLQVMTKPDGLVRPQYMATCLANACKFVLRFSPGIEGGLVECTSQLVLSLPEPSGDRYPVANLKVHIALGVPTNPQDPATIDYKLQTMDIIIPSMEVLRPTAQFLVESGLLEHPPMSPFPQTPGGPNPFEDNDTFRDVFLQQSQNMLQNSTVGLKSAWKQLDSVAGFSTKMNMMQKILPTTDGSVLEAAMQEQEAYQRQLQNNAQQQQRLSNNIMPTGDDTVPVSYPPQAARPPPAVPQARPTSLLGSFMGAIAKSVTLPEEDPSIYEHYGNPHAPPQPPSSFPRPAGGAAPMVQLYRQEEKPTPSQGPPAAPLSQPIPATQPEKKTSPWLSRMTKPLPTPPAPSQPAQLPVPAAPTVPVPAPQTAQKDDIDDDEDLGLDDGWGEDDDLALDVEDDDTTGEEEAVEAIERKPSATIQQAPPVANKTVSQPSTVQPSSRQFSSVPSPKPTSFDATKSNLASKNPDDDIVPTRKRWVNPRPGPRYLRPL